MSATSAANAVSIVLVHGGFVDGSGWQGVYNLLKKDGYKVSIVQNPTISLEDDVSVTRRVLAAQPGPVILAGHSYGGVVITEAGNDPRVVGLVYIAAFAPDKGESVSALINDPPARVDAATRMLRSPLFDRVTAAQIGRRAGFSDASHFTRVLRRHTGQTPLQMRRAR